MPIIIGSHVIGKQVAPRAAATRESQAKRPTGWMGRLVLRRMNASHSRVTDWGLAQICVQPRDIILDVGCGGGRTISKLAAMAKEGKINGVDFSKESVAVAAKTNRAHIESGRVDIREASVSKLPFPESMFDLVTAVETHFWWPDLPKNMREVFRVLKPGGTLCLIAEVFKGASSAAAKFAEPYLEMSGLKLLTVDEHRELLTGAGFAEIQISTQKSWLCATAKKS